MKVEQFIDKGLAHFSYAILSENKIALVDPARNPDVYIEFAKNNDAEIVAVIETHTHADFVSSHIEFSNLGAKIYASKHSKAQYNPISFDDGDILKLGKIKLKALNTPGHSLDSISIVLEDEEGNNHAVFTGDTLFLGDVGRPDLREHTGDNKQLKESLAAHLYDSLRDKLMKLPDSTIVFPAHGAGSSCGKSMSSDLYGTIIQQKEENYALQKISKEEFIKILIHDQPSIPKYFSFDVELNRQGPPLLKDSLKRIKEISYSDIDSAIIIDTRPADQYKKGHYKNSINIQNGLKFETWLGTIVSPYEKFYFVINENEKKDILLKTSKIGYELKVAGIITVDNEFPQHDDLFDINKFNQRKEDFTIVDVREKSEVDALKYFNHSKNIPLGELRERVSELPFNKHIAVHCAGGYRSAIGTSIINSFSKNKAFDISEDIKKYKS